MKAKKDSKMKYFRFGILVFLWLLLIGALSYAYFSVLFDNSEKTTADQDCLILILKQDNTLIILLCGLLMMKMSLQTEKRVYLV